MEGKEREDNWKEEKGKESNRGDEKGRFVI